MNEEKLLELLNSPEDERHDFKERWYTPGKDSSKKAEMLKDIFSFVNTTHDDDCYLIFGVTDERKIAGVEEDENRYTTQTINDWLNKLPIEPETPSVKVENVCIEGHEVDVMTIKNTDKVPVFLKSEVKGKGYGRHPISPGQVFARREDTNTSINGTANYTQLTKLFRKQLGLNKPIEERFKNVLNDWRNWYYYEHTNEIGIQYSIDPDFRIVLVDREADAKIESFSLSQYSADITWEIAQLNYKNNTIVEIDVVNLDGGRFKAVVPDVGSLTKNGRELFYRYYLKNSTKFHLETLINKMTSSIGPDKCSFEKFMESIAVYEDNEHQKRVEQYLNCQEKKINDAIEIDKKEIASCRDYIKTDLPEDSSELSDLAIANMITWFKVGKYIGKFLREHPEI